MKKIIEVYPSEHPQRGATVTYSTPSSRKSFSLPVPKKSNQPSAVESFAQDPEYYQSLMEAVSELSKKQQSQER